MVILKSHKTYFANTATVAISHFLVYTYFPFYYLSSEVLSTNKHLCRETIRVLPLGKKVDQGLSPSSALLYYSLDISAFVKSKFCLTTSKYGRSSDLKMQNKRG